VRLLDRTGWIADPLRRDGDAPTLVPLAEVETLLPLRAPDRPIGIEVPNNAEAASLDSLLDRLDIIAILFPAHRDGRGFSLGRALRERGFAGRLRISGALIPDQFAFALACGFDEVEIDEERARRQPIGQWLAAAGAFELTYQQVRDGRRSILAARAAA
jgi:uncharacterized protein (DUF934 family)